MQVVLAIRKPMAMVRDKPERVGGGQGQVIVPHVSPLGHREAPGGCNLTVPVATTAVVKVMVVAEVTMASKVTARRR